MLSFILVYLGMHSQQSLLGLYVQKVDGWGIVSFFFPMDIQQRDSVSCNF